MGQYSFSYDEAYVIAFLSRYRRQSNAYPWFMAVKATCLLGLVALLVTIVVLAVRQAHANWPALLLLALIPAFFIFLLLLGPRLGYFLLRRNMKKSPFYGCEVQLAITDTGVTANTPKSQLTMAWSAYTAAKRVADGFMLFSGSSVIHWLPDQALVAGVVGEVERLLRANVRAYEGAAA